MHILAWALQILFVPLLAPLGVGIINKIKAKVQRRQGAGLLQPYRDIRKLLHKDEVISEDASFIFNIAPYIVFGITLIVGASVPLFTSVIHLPSSDLITVVLLLATGTFFLALAGMDTGSSFGGFGSSREMTLSALVEGLFIASILVLVILHRTTNLYLIAGSVHLDYADLIAVALAGVSFFIVLLAETNRFPFDNVDTHLELTMIHEAMLLEYSGKKLALMEWASANKLIIFAAMLVNLYFPVGLASNLQFGTIALAITIFIAKLLVVYVAIAVLESVIAKLRFFRLPGLLFTAFILCLIAIGLVK